MSGDLPDKPSGTPSSAPPPPPDSSALSAPSAAPPQAPASSPAPPPMPKRLHEFLAESHQLAARAPPPPIYAPNRVLPRFIRLLALWVFLIGGTVGAATAWFYKTILHPRLVQRLEMLTKLHQHGLVGYEAFAGAVNKLAQAKGFRMIRPAKDEAEERTVAASLSSLSTALATKQTPTPAPDAFPSLAQTLTTPTPALKPLNVSLVELTSFIENQSLASHSLSYRYGTYGTSSGASTPGLTEKQLELRQVVSTLKGEIRSVKGVLLNRRNFAALGPRAEGVAA